MKGTFNAIVLWLSMLQGSALVPSSKASVVNGSRLRVLTRDGDVVAQALTAADNNSHDDMSIFEILAGNVAQCLVLSDIKRHIGNDGASTGWTSWVDDKTCFRLQKCIGRMSLFNPMNPTDPTRIDLLEKRDESQRWIRWMKNAPEPMMVELSNELRQAVNEIVSDDTIERIHTTREEFLERIGCRVVMLPSGKELPTPIRTPAGAMAFGKLLYGGVTRYRMLGGGKNIQRRAGERTEVYNSNTPSEAWLQYGGPARMYEAVDMGPCAVLEVLILPLGLTLENLHDDMSVSKFGWDPRIMFDITSEEDIERKAMEDVKNKTKTSNLDYKSDPLGRISNFETSFQSKVGGLSKQVEAIVRRVLDGRVIRPASEQGEESDDGDRAAEAQALLELGLQPVKGLLLYGPPGCGKTALAREISRALDARPPKIVSAPELLDRWVGGSEKLVRSLFVDAELELKQCNNDPTKSALHVIVIDEIDAVFRKRSSAEDSGEVTRASAVNQILSMLDGINSPTNILVIGMTNRRELLDDALLRPGRLEVQVRIPLPDQAGRREILQIHFDPLRRRGRLSKPLCEAIDGVRQVNDEENQSFLRKKLKRSLSLTGRQVKDLAADQWTRSFSGADIAGLVRNAGSLALARVRKNDESLENLLITIEDVVEALKEVKR